MGLGRAIFGNDRYVREAGVILLPGAPPVEVLLKPSTRTRRLSLRISRLDGRVTLSLPTGLRRSEAEAFVAEKAEWIRGHLADVPDEIAPMPGGTLLFEGRSLSIVAAPRRSVTLTNTGIEVPERQVETTPARVAAFLKHHARERLVEASERHAAAIGRQPGRITLRDTRSRWGSCSHEGNLMYSWRLVMAPPPVLDYVAAHEVAHMVHMDHSSAFWAQVEALFPDHRAQRRWLRENSSLLHRYRFRD